jgi:hypothetical protein
LNQRHAIWDKKVPFSGHFLCNMHVLCISVLKEKQDAG